VVAAKGRLEQAIVNIATEEKCSLMEAVLYYCETKMFDPADIGKKLSKEMVEKIGEEARKLHMLKDK